MNELAALAEACNVEVLETMTQRADAPTPNYYIGSGKVDELKQLIATTGADLVIFDDELSPSHIRNLEKASDAKVIDRTILILDIFASRAKTKEAMLQVELAQSQYMLPRVVGLHSSLSRQKAGPDPSGPGEQQIELDRRILRDNIHRLKEELKELVQIRRTQRAKRQKDGLFTVAIAGYTNAGKSSLLNQLMTHSILKQDKVVFEKNMLFATLGNHDAVDHARQQPPVSGDRYRWLHQPAAAPFGRSV
ncbi:MAG: GTPase HflX [Bacillus subtilis]|nr:GTPase HflX [Bacillus subtilis]